MKKRERRGQNTVAIHIGRTTFSSAATFQSLYPFERWLEHISATNAYAGPSPFETRTSSNASKNIRGMASTNTPAHAHKAEYPTDMDRSLSRKINAPIVTPKTRAKYGRRDARRSGRAKQDSSSNSSSSKSWSNIIV